jgi:hypothetical protein
MTLRLLEYLRLRPVHAAVFQTISFPPMAARRPLLMLLLSMVAGWSFAQAPASSVPLPPPPPPGPDIADADLEPQVTIVRSEDQVTEEVRIRGELRYLRVTPRHGRPYYLIPDVNGATYIRRDSLDSTLKVPMWVLFSF